MPSQNGSSLFKAKHANKTSKNFYRDMLAEACTNTLSMMNKLPFEPCRRGLKKLEIWNRDDVGFL